jgi:hypothetical protein
LQKSKLVSVRIFGETLEREAIDDSYNLSRVTEVADEFSVKRQRFRKKSSLGARQQSVSDGENGRQSSRDSRPSTPPALLVNHEEHGFGIIKTAL